MREAFFFLVIIDASYHIPYFCKEFVYLPFGHETVFTTINILHLYISIYISFSVYQYSTYISFFKKENYQQLVHPGTH